MALAQCLMVIIKSLSIWPMSKEEIWFLIVFVAAEISDFTF